MQKIIRRQLIRLYSYFNKNPYSRAFFYHDLHYSSAYTEMSTSVDLFTKHINTARSLGYSIVPDIDNDKMQIEISFDDGFLGLFKNIEVINSLSVPIRLFIVSSYIGKKNYLNIKQLVELANNPLISIASHTHTHRPLTLLDYIEIKNELQDSKKILSDIIGMEINCLCYPLGMFSKKISIIAKDLGYTKQYSSVPGNFKDDIFPDVKRRSLVQHARDKEFLSIIKGGDKFLSYWYLNKHCR